MISSPTPSLVCSSERASPRCPACAPALQLTPKTTLAFYRLPSGGYVSALLALACCGMRRPAGCLLTATCPPALPAAACPRGGVPAELPTCQRACA